jgi:hypothetical protein
MLCSQCRTLQVRAAATTLAIQPPLPCSPLPPNIAPECELDRGSQGFLGEPCGTWRPVGETGLKGLNLPLAPELDAPWVCDRACAMCCARVCNASIRVVGVGQSPLSQFLISVLHTSSHSPSPYHTTWQVSSQSCLSVKRQCFVLLTSQMRGQNGIPVAEVGVQSG